MDLVSVNLAAADQDFLELVPQPGFQPAGYEQSPLDALLTPESQRSIEATLKKIKLKPPKKCNPCTLSEIRARYRFDSPNSNIFDIQIPGPNPSCEPLVARRERPSFQPANPARLNGPWDSDRFSKAMSIIRAAFEREKLRRADYKIWIATHEEARQAREDVASGALLRQAAEHSTIIVGVSDTSQNDTFEAELLRAQFSRRNWRKASNSRSNFGTTRRISAKGKFRRRKPPKEGKKKLWARLRKQRGYKNKDHGRSEECLAALRNPGDKHWRPVPFEYQLARTVVCPVFFKVMEEIQLVREKIGKRRLLPAFNKRPWTVKTRLITKKLRQQAEKIKTMLKGSKLARIPLSIW